MFIRARIGSGIVAIVLAGATCVGSAAFAQCPQGWVENGGLSPTEGEGSIAAAGELAVPGHVYTFAAGRFDFLDHAALLNFAAFDNGVAMSPQSHPGWEGVSGKVVQIKEYEGKLYFGGIFTVNGVANVPLLGWDGAQLEVFPPVSLLNTLYGVGIGSSGGQRVVVLSKASSPSLMKLDGSQWAGLPNVPSGFGYDILEVLDNVPGATVVVGISAYGSLYYLGSSGGWQQPASWQLSSGYGLRCARAVGHGNDATLYVGGLFAKIGGLTVKNIAMFRHGAWDTVGGGVASEVFSITESGDGNPVIGTRLGSATANSTYVPLPSVLELRGGGWQPLLSAPDYFSTVLRGAAGLARGTTGVLLFGDYRMDVTPGAPAALARWDGNAWSSVVQRVRSGGTVGAIEKIDLGDGGRVYAGGNFRTTDGRVQSMVRLSGSVWEQVGSNIPYTYSASGSFSTVGSGVSAIALARTSLGPRLVAGGYFGNLFLKYFDGAQWTSFTRAPDNWNVNQFVDFDAGSGLQTFAVIKGGNPPLWRLDGLTWNPVSIRSGQEYTGVQFAAAQFNNGTTDAIYIGNNAGGSSTPLHFVQRWTPGAGLENVDSGFSVTRNGAGVMCLVKVREAGQERLLVGGDFKPSPATAPGCRYLARLNGDTWEQVMPVPPLPVVDLAVHDFGSGPVLTALLNDSQPGGNSATRLFTYRLVNGAWERFGDFDMSVPSLYAHNMAVGVMREIDGTLYVGGPILGVDGKVTNMIARFGPGECACASDFNHDGTVDVFDELDFLSAFAAGEITADVNHDDVIDLFDYLDFLARFSAGC